MTTETKHTPTPLNTSIEWSGKLELVKDDDGRLTRVGQYSSYAGSYEIFADCSYKATHGTKSEEKAAHIFRCVNAHDELVEAIELLIIAADVNHPRHEAQTTNYCSLGSALREAKAALRKARGEA